MTGRADCFVATLLTMIEWLILRRAQMSGGQSGGQVEEVPGVAGENPLPGVIADIQRVHQLHVGGHVTDGPVRPEQESIRPVGGRFREDGPEVVPYADLEDGGVGEAGDVRVDVRQSP